MYTYIFISLYTSNLAISLIRNVNNIIILGPDIKEYITALYMQYV